MDPVRAAESNKWIGLGFLLTFVACIVQGCINEVAGILLYVPSFFFWMKGCAYYAEAKGQSSWYGAFGILALPGLIVLWLLPDDMKEDQ